MISRSDSISLFRLLARALSYPERDYVGQIQDVIGNVRLELWDDPNLPLSDLIEELGQLAQLPLDQVQGEHTRLFVAAYPRVPCPPYESAYREGQLSGDAAGEVDRLYRRWGLSVDGEEVDHAGAELEFAAFLLAMNTTDSLSAAGKFFSEHLHAWLPGFATDLARDGRLGFYRALGTLLAVTLEAGVELPRSSCNPRGH